MLEYELKAGQSGTGTVPLYHLSSMVQYVPLVPFRIYLGTLFQVATAGTQQPQTRSVSDVRLDGRVIRATRRVRICPEAFRPTNPDFPDAPHRRT